MKKRSKKYNAKEKIMELIVGSINAFDVVDPLSDHPELTNISYHHKNPISRLRLQGQMKFVHDLFLVRKFRWRSEIRMEFRCANEVYERVAEIKWFGTLLGTEETYQKTIEEMFERSNMNHYVVTHVKAEVIGLDNIVKESDFTISKEDAA